MGNAANKREKLEQTELLLMGSYPNGTSKRAIAQTIGVDEATIHRYFYEIDNLEEVGRGKYTLDPKLYTRNVRLTSAEVITVYLALRKFIRQTGKTATFMITALQRLLPIFKSSSDLYAILEESIRALEAERPKDEAYTKLWQSLLEAWQGEYLLEIDYLKSSADTPETHIIEPYLFEPQLFGDGIYLIAYSHTRKDLRTFRSDRIIRASVLPRQFNRKERQPKLDDLLKHSWGIWYGEDTVRVELLFRAGAPAKRVLEGVYLPTEKKEMQADGTLHWSAEVVGLVEILSWVRGWGDGVVVLSPAELRERIVQDARATLALYGE